MSDRPTIRFASKVSQRGYTVAQNIVLFDLRLSATARLLYLHLGHYAWRNPDSFPTQEEIAANVGRRARQLRNYLIELEARWLLERNERGHGRAVEYVLYEPGADYLERKPRPPARTAKRPVENPGDGPVEGESSSATYCRASSATDCRPARQPIAEPRVREGSEALEVQEDKGRRLAVGRAATRDETQRVADEAERSLRLGGSSS